MNVTCPHCGSSDLHAESLVPRTMRVAAWTLNPDTGVPEPADYDGSDEELFLDAETPTDTYACRDCGTTDIPAHRLLIDGAPSGATAPVSLVARLHEALELAYTALSEKRGFAQSTTAIKIRAALAVGKAGAL